MRSIPPFPVFTIEQARAAGATSSSLKHATRRKELLRLSRGVYARPDSDPALRNDFAAALRYPDAPLSDTSAARAWSLPLLSVIDECPAVTVAPRSNADLPGIHAYRATLREQDLRLLGGRLVTSPARTAIDLARHHKLITAVPALDHVLHHGLASAEELRDVLEFCQDWPGARRAIRAAVLCDSRSESPLESVSRLALPRWGLPAPEPQVLIVDADGVVIARSDFYWGRPGVVGEADGRGKYADLDVLDAEKIRHERLDDLGLEVTRWGWGDIWRRQGELASRVRRAFDRGAERDRAGMARRWTAVSTPRLVIL